MKRYCAQNIIYSGVCNKSYVANIYPNPSKSQGHIINVFKKLLFLL